MFYNQSMNRDGEFEVASRNSVTVVCPLNNEVWCGLIKKYAYKL
jgi:hypothetical protein